jgi:predicted MFS family arabinose efflux permease
MGALQSRRLSATKSAAETVERVEPASRAVPHGAALYLGLVQFLFATTWTIYVIFLPQLLESVGIPRQYAAWILVLDQLIFSITDFLMGVVADRVRRMVAVIGPALMAVTALSCVCFMLLSQVPQLGAGSVPSALFLILTILWVVSSSALRAPAWALIAQYAPVPSLPWLAALALVGMGVGGATSSYLGAALRNLDPRIPFALSSATLFITAAGLVWVEQALMRNARTDETAPAPPPPVVTRPYTVFLGGTILLALGFQAHIAFNSIPQYLRYASPQDLDKLLPIFWVGFNLLSLPASALVPRWGGPRVMAGAAVLGAAGTMLAANAPDLITTIVGQALAGGAWGTVFVAGLATALQLGRSGSEGSTSGLWFSTQSLAAFLRILLIATQINQSPDFQLLTTWAAPALWLAAAGALAGLVWSARGFSRPVSGQA